MVADWSDARAAMDQVWSPFVLVAGLLLIGLVADDDGLFAMAGYWLARVAPSGVLLFFGATVMVGVVTAVLNLDTSVAFLTPVLVYTARSRGEGEAPLLYGCLLLSNAGSLFLPGSNLTNLIVLGHLHLSGGGFLARMWAPALAALVVTAAVVAVFEHRSLRVTASEPDRPERSVLGLGALAVGLATVLVVVLRSPALPVAVVGVVAIAIRLAAKKDQPRHVAQVLGLPVLLGLFGVAVGLGTLGRAWSGPATVLSAPGPVGNGRVRRRHLGGGQQPPGRLAARGPHPPPPVRSAHRAEPGAEPVRDRFAGLAAVATHGSLSRGRAVDRQSQPDRRCRRPAVDGGRARAAGRHRLKLTERSSRLPPDRPYGSLLGRLG